MYCTLDHFFPLSCTLFLRLLLYTSRHIHCISCVSFVLSFNFQALVSLYFNLDIFFSELYLILLIKLFLIYLKKIHWIISRILIWVIGFFLCFLFLNRPLLNFSISFNISLHIYSTFISNSPCWLHHQFCCGSLSTVSASLSYHSGLSCLYFPR